MVMAASCEAMPTGWWDVKAKPTAGWLRRVLNKVHDLRVLGIPVELCKKNSVAAHLPCGYHESITKAREKRKGELKVGKKQSALRET